LAFCWEQVLCLVFYCLKFPFPTFDPRLLPLLLESIRYPRSFYYSEYICSKSKLNSVELSRKCCWIFCVKKLTSWKERISCHICYYMVHQAKAKHQLFLLLPYKFYGSYYQNMILELNASDDKRLTWKLLLETIWNQERNETFKVHEMEQLY
jgi:hypothetical protein